MNSEVGAGPKNKRCMKSSYPNSKHLWRQWSYTLHTSVCMQREVAPLHRRDETHAPASSTVGNVEIHAPPVESLQWQTLPDTLAIAPDSLVKLSRGDLSLLEAFRHVFDYGLRALDVDLRTDQGLEHLCLHPCQASLFQQLGAINSVGEILAEHFVFESQVVVRLFKEIAKQTKSFIDSLTINTLT